MFLQRNMKRDKKIIAIIVLTIAVVVFGIGNITFFLLYSQYSILVEEKITLVVGVSSGPADIDPLNAEDSASCDVIRQVAEGLYMYDYTDPDLPRVPILAVGEGVWEDNLTWTISLQDDVWFHDYEKFDATVVKWNFDRLMWFSNVSGALNATLFKNYPLFELPNGTFILDDVIVNSEYSVTFKLNVPYSPFKDLLCHTSCYMLSPKSTPRWEYIDTLTGELVGTGPFMYDEFVEDKKVKLTRWGWYWRRGAFFEEIIFSIIEDSTTRNNAMLNHEIDYLTDFISYLIPTFEADASITLSHPIMGLDYQYLAFKNTQINDTWRKAISYAINYTYIIEELQDGAVYRANGPIAPNMFGYDPTVKAPDYNLTYAREIVVSMGYGNLSWTDNQWRTGNFQSWNYSYSIGNDFREDLGVLLLDNLDLIGIEVIDDGLSFADFIYRPYSFLKTYLQRGHLCWLGWTPNYLDLMDTFLCLFSNNSIPEKFEELKDIPTYNVHFNLAFVNNSWLEQKFAQALKETNDTSRSIIYSEIQFYLTEELFPHAFGFHSKVYFVHSTDLRNVPYNAFRAFYAWPIYRDSYS